MQVTNEVQETVSFDSIPGDAIGGGTKKDFQLTPEQYKKLIHAMNAAANKEVQMKNRKERNRRRNKAAHKARRANRGK